jgi:hypothetical protein
VSNRQTGGRDWFEFVAAFLRRSKEHHIMKSGLKSIFGLQLLAAAVALAACSGLPQSSTSTGGSGTGTGFTIGGTVTGLSGTGLVLQDNGGDNLTITKSGPFVFPTGIATNGAFAVTVATQPTNPAQSCAVTGGSGTATANVTSVSVVCTTAASNATVGVTVSGLSGSGLVLQDNGGDSLAITANGSFNFKTPVNGAYAVTVLSQPTVPNQLCTVTKGSGIATGNVSGIAVACTNSFVIGGNVNGVVGTGLVLQDNKGDNLAITTNGAFAFKTQLATGSAYAVTVLTQPTSPAQTCTVTTGTGNATADVTSVVINCPAVTFSIGGSVVGLLGKQPTPPNNAPLTDNSFQLLNNGGDNRIITQNGPFTFPTPVNINGQYNLSVISFPSTQNEGCTLWNYKGTAIANVTSIIVDCAHDDWTWINGGKTAGIDVTAPDYGQFPASPPTTVPNPFTNTPGGRDGGATWTDASGNLWLFGGDGFELAGNQTPDNMHGFLNDLWVCAVGSGDFCQWQLTEAPVAGLFPISQHEDISTTGNRPGGRQGAATWVSGGTNLYLFGGQGIDSNGAAGLLADLWKVDSTNGTWTLVGGSSTVRNQTGVYTGAVGTLHPGSRWAPMYWTDGSGNFWMFGGFGYDANGNIGYLSDLWKFDGTNWTFVSAAVPNSNAQGTKGVYGTQGTAAAGNSPGGRQSASGWIDAAGNLWLFGGEGLDSVGTGDGTANGSLNDLWEYSITNNQWAWVGGLNTANVDGVYGAQPLIGPSDATSAAGTVGLTPVTPSIAPGSRWASNAWTDHTGHLWLFGGWGHDADGTHGNGFLNDLWVYTPSATFGQLGTWTWVRGSTTGGQNGVYGDELRGYKTFVNWTPGGRRAAMSWIDLKGELWVLGGEGYDSTNAAGNGLLNDMWRYLPYP